MILHKHILTIFHFIENALAKQGKVLIGNVGHDIEKQREEIEDYFTYTVENFPFVTATLSYNYAEKATQKHKDYVKRVANIDKSGNIVLNALELFEVNSLDELKEIQAFLLYIKTLIVTDCTCRIKLSYETAPMRLEAFVSTGFRDSAEKNESITAELDKRINDSPVIKHWTKQIAKELKNIGRWSWINFSKDSGLFDPKESHAIYMAMGKILDEVRAKEDNKPKTVAEIETEIDFD
jgi:hypothetical protein